MKLFSLCYTSRRPAEMGKVIEMWRNRADNPAEVEVILGLDGNDIASIAAAAEIKDISVVIQPDPPFNCVRGWNLAAEKSTGLVIIAIADDFVPPPSWDTHLKNVVKDDARTEMDRQRQGKSYPGWIDREHVVHVNDGYVKDLCTLAILTRIRYDRFGYLWYPEYQSLFCDTEFTTVAYRDSVVVKAPHLLFEHVHPDCGKRERDATDLTHASSERWKTGETLFNSRRARSFPVDRGPKAVAAPAATGVVLSRKYGVYIQATKDDFCLYEVCHRLYETGARAFFFAIPDEYWNGTKTPAEDIAQVTAIATRIGAELAGAEAHCKVFNVAPYRMVGPQAETTETAVRNASLDWVRDSGFEHVLVVDGDELWINDLLYYVDKYVDEHRPEALGIKMIPVVGLPGYPIGQASDIATIYLGPTIKFRSCRGPAATQQIVLNWPGVVHFTGTRKTMKEIIDKHRNSGHYNDPSYDFEGWINNVLPNIRPGMTNVHMYKRYQIWPYVRNWTVSEHAQIPESLRQYLGKPSQSAHEPFSSVLRGTKMTIIDSGRPAEGTGSTVQKATPYKKSRVDSFSGIPKNPFHREEGHPAK